MASSTEDISGSPAAKKKRSVNFSNSEILKLEELVKEEKTFSIITSKFSNTVTNKLKKEIWENIAKEISAQGVALRSAHECSNKWQNLKRDSKQHITTEKMERRKTGGGTVTKSASEQHIRIADMHKESASFNGIKGGIDSDEADGLHYLSNLPVVPTEEAVPSDEQASSSKCSKTVTDKKEKRFSSKSEELQYWQLQYFKGMVEKQEREKQLLDIKIRMLLAEEKRRDREAVNDLINLTYFEE